MKKKNLIWIFVSIAIITLGYFVYKTQHKKEDNSIIKIGAILPKTGGANSSASIPAIDAENGMHLAIEQFNANSTSTKLELLTQDSKADKKVGLDAYRYLNTVSNIKYFVTQISGVTLAIKPEIRKNNQYLISMVGAVNFKDDCPTCIRNYIAPTIIGQEVTKIISDTLKFKNISILYPETEYGKSIFTSVQSFLNAKGIIVKSSVAYDEKTGDFRNIVNKLLLTKNFDGVFVTGLGKSIGLIIKNLREAGYKGQIVSDHSANMPEVKEIAGNLLKGTYCFVFPKLDSKFNDAFQKKFKYVPSFYAGLGYNCIVYIIKREFPDFQTPLIYDKYQIKDNELIYNFEIKHFQ